MMRQNIRNNAYIEATANQNLIAVSAGDTITAGGSVAIPAIASPILNVGMIIDSTSTDLPIARVSGINTYSRFSEFKNDKHKFNKLHRYWCC